MNHQGTEQRNTDLPMRARHRGQQFLVTLKAIKATAGLVAAPFPLVHGEPIVLQATGLSGPVNSVQIFAKVGRVYEDRNLFVVTWEKAVSPTGMTALFEFLQAVLGAVLDRSRLSPHGVVDGEMAFFDFHAGTFAVPSRGIATHSEDALDLLARRTQDDLKKTAGSTGPIPGGDDPHAGRTHVPPGRAGHGSPLSPHTPSASPRPHGGSADAHAPRGSSARPAQADDGMVDMFGIKVSKAAWEQLENVRFSGTSPASEKAGELARQGAAANRGKPPPPEDDGHPPPNRKEKDKSPSLLRRLASKLADKD